MSPASRDPLATLSAIESLRGTLSLARALVDAGRDVDLAGLDANAAALCAAVSLLPLESARTLRAPLLALLAEVDGLGAALAPP